MKLKKLFYVSGLLLLLCFFSACEGGGATSDNIADNFDRSAMLVHWADNIIIPSYENFSQKTQSLTISSDAFIADPTLENLQSVRLSFEAAYMSWQKVAMYEIGPAKDLFLRSFLNIYPTNSANIDALIISENYNLNDPNLNDEQGFPALDYLLFGLSDTDEAILQNFTNADANKYKNYMNDVVMRIDALANEVLNAWNTNYRSVFVSNTGASANSSMNRLANAYLEYYERFFRNGKIGFPAGVFSTGGTANPNIVEAFYKKDLSKTLCLTALDALKDFFNGDGVNSNQSGPSFKAYLDYLNISKNGQNLSTLINNQFQVSETAINGLGDSFYDQIINDNTAMLNAFEALQDNVILLKSDMFSALSLTVEFQSGDGD